MPVRESNQRPATFRSLSQCSTFELFPPLFGNVKLRIFKKMEFFQVTTLLQNNFRRRPKESFLAAHHRNFRLSISHLADNSTFCKLFFRFCNGALFRLSTFSGTAFRLTYFQRPSLWKFGISCFISFEVLIFWVWFILRVYFFVNRKTLNKCFFWIAF